MIDYPPLNETWGWREEEVGIIPVWYTRSQFPSNTSQSDTDSNDDEGAEVVDGRENNEEESPYDSDYDFDDDSDGSEDDF